MASFDTAFDVCAKPPQRETVEDGDAALALVESLAAEPDAGGFVKHAVPYDDSKMQRLEADMKKRFADTVARQTMPDDA